MVRVLVRSRVVVHVEQTVILVLVIIATRVEARVRRVEVPVIARKRSPRTRTDSPYIFFSYQMCLKERRGGVPPRSPPIRATLGGDSRGSRS